MKLRTYTIPLVPFGSSTKDKPFRPVFWSADGQNRALQNKISSQP